MKRINIDDFAEMVRINKGFKVPMWATDQRLAPGQKIMIVLKGLEKVVPARATGKYERKQHVVWHRDENGRKWRLRLRSTDVIIGYDNTPL